MFRLKYSSLSTFFIALLILFFGILVFFYMQSISSVKSVLSEQLAGVSGKLAVRIDKRYSQLQRESKLLSRNQSLRAVFNRPITDRQPNIDQITEFIRWFRRNAEIEYLAVVYTDALGNIVFDSEQGSTSNAVVSNVAIPISRKYTEAIFKAFQSTEIPPDNNLSIRVISQDLTNKLVILRRATNMRGDNGILYAVVSWNTFIDTDLNELSGIALFDRSNSQLVYSSNEDITSAIPGSDISEVISEFEFQKNQYLAMTIQVDSLWLVTTFIQINNYLEKPQRLGRITLMVSLLFIVVSASIIWVLIHRVKKNTQELEAAHRDMLSQNEELQRAKKVVEAHSLKLEKELATASSMQMKLMPTEDPQFEGVSIAGFCRPASQVGGDFYQYYKRPNGRLSVVLADVTGHGMEAAIPNVLFSGMLDNMMESNVQSIDLCTRLNKSLYRSLDSRTFVCFSMGELDTKNRSISLTNGSCPYPYYYDLSSKSVRELAMDAFPLGARKASEYSVMDLTLDVGDRIIFCSDGIIEATNEVGDIYGFDRIRLLIESCCKQELSNRDLIDHLMTDVDSFRNGQEQEDDQTVVVLHIVE